MTGADSIGPGVDGAVISADSHVTEPPEAYADIDPRFADRAPTLVHLDGMGATMLTDPGSPHQGRVPFSMIAGAGVPADELGFSQGKRWEELHHGGYDAAARLLEQDRDGIAAEVLYPSVGMLLCNHPDFDYKQACFDAYNRWLAAWCAHAPDRLWGVGQSAMRSPEDGIADLASIRELGLRGVMLPGVPAGEDYDHPAYDEFWEAAVDVGLPISFHILTGGAGGLASDAYRGPKMNSFLGIIRGNQDLLGTLIFGGVFERHPRLRVVCVEADAGWRQVVATGGDDDPRPQNTWRVIEVKVRRQGDSLLQFGNARLVPCFRDPASRQRVDQG